MANATTAQLPPINGLYTAFFSVMAYFIFGTSKHLSLGKYKPTDSFWSFNLYKMYIKELMVSYP